jgi:hypothetical protein
MELAMGILGSIGSYHFKRKLFSSRPTARRAPPVLDDSDDEEAPQ